MPWFPDFIAAVELARLENRVAGHEDPVARYLTALQESDTDILESTWPGEVVIYDPRAGVVRGHRQLRQYIKPILDPANADPGGVVARYLSALDAGDTDAIVDTFEPDGYFRESIGPNSWHQGTKELHSFFAKCFSAGGGLSLQRCALTDDGVRCALEYNFVRWGSHDVPPQAGIAIFERGPDELLAAVRAYDDVEAPSGTF